MKTALTLLLCCLGGIFLFSQEYVTIPDLVFEQALIDAEIDKAGLLDNKILKSEAEATGTINIYHKDITNLTGIEAFTNLTYLRCSHCKLQNVDVSQNTKVITMMFDYNQLSEIDVSENIDLIKLHCNSNNLTSLNVNTNTSLEELACGRNQLTSLDINSNTNLKTLYCDYNQLGELDVTNNSTLIRLYAGNNQISELDVTLNPNITILQFGRNPITSIDLSNNISLFSLSCPFAQLSTLDLSNNFNLSSLNCINNQLTSLDLSNNIQLTALSCHNNQLSTLDVSHNTAIWSLYCWNNQLTELDVSNMPLLRYINCSGNSISELDFSQNYRLENLKCWNNQLTTLDVRNGNNSILHTLQATDNNLDCIDIDNTSNIPSNWLVDPNTSFSTSCKGIYIPDPHFEQALIDLEYDHDGIINHYISTEDALAVNDLSVFQRGIYDLTGIEGFKNLKTMNCGSNNLTSLDLTQNVALTGLVCNNNPLTSLDVSGNINLDFLWCHDTELTNLDLSNNANLTRLDCYNSSLTSLNVTNNPLLTVLYCNNNFLATIDLSHNPALTYLQIHNNLFSTIDLSANTALGYLECNNNQLTSLDLSQNSSIFTLFCHNNQLSELNVSHLSSLRYIHCQNNIIENLDLSNNGILTSVKCFNNQLNYLDLRNGNNIGIYTMNARNNHLTCIAVDDPGVIFQSWLVDVGVSFKCDCVAPEAIIKDLTVELDQNGTVSITAYDIDDGSYDNLTPPENLTFSIDFDEFSCANIGPNTVIFTVSDDCGNNTSITSSVFVTDNLTPVMLLNSDPVMILEKNNHKPHTITVEDCVIDIYDNCSPLSFQDIVIYKVESDEEEDADDGRDGRDGKTSDDMIISDDCLSVVLLDENYSGGTGRVYTIYLTVEDEFGNATTNSCEVHVPIRNQAVIKESTQYEVTNKNCTPTWLVNNLRSENIKDVDPGLKLSLEQNFPNPFVENTSIHFRIHEKGLVLLEVFDIQGNVISTIVQEEKLAGSYFIDYRPDNIPPGMYIISLKMNRDVMVKKMVKTTN